MPSSRRPNAGPLRMGVDRSLLPPSLPPSPSPSPSPSGGDVGHVLRKSSPDPVGETRRIIGGPHYALGKEVGRAPTVVEEKHLGRLADPVHPRPLEFGVERAHADMEPRVIERVSYRMRYVGIAPSYAPSLELSSQDRQFPGQVRPDTTTVSGPSCTVEARSPNGFISPPPEPVRNPRLTGPLRISRRPSSSRSACRPPTASARPMMQTAGSGA